MSYCRKCQDKSFLIECACGCGQIKGRRTSYGKKTRFIFKHNSKDGPANPNWKGGRHKDQFGYWLLWKPDHPDANNLGYVREHRLLLEQQLGRRLSRTEVVHHIDGDRGNNDITNLILFGSNGDHLREELTGIKRPLELVHRFALLQTGRKHSEERRLRQKERMKGICYTARDPVSGKFIRRPA